MSRESRAVLALALSALSACQSRPAPQAEPPRNLADRQSFTFAAMGSPWILEFENPVGSSLDNAETERMFQRTLRHYEETFSDWSDDSELRRLEAQGLDSPSYLKASPLFSEGLELARQAFKASGGTFDLTVGAVQWKERSRPAGMISLDILRDTQKFRFGVNPARLTFGGIAKGMVIGDLAERLARNGIQSFRIEGGGGNAALAGSFLDLVPRGHRGRDRENCSPVHFVARSSAKQEGRPHIINPRSPSTPVSGKIELVCRSCRPAEFKRVGALGDAFTKALLIEKMDLPEDLDCSFTKEP